MSESPYPSYGQQPAYGSAPQYAPPGPPPASPGPAATPAHHFGPPAPPPPANAGWAVAALLFFWPLSFSAFTHAFNVYPLWAAGDLQGAQYASERAKQLGKWSLYIFIGLFVLFIVFYVVIIATIISSLPRY